MNKTYYQDSLITNISNETLKNTFKSIGMNVAKLFTPTLFGGYTYSNIDEVIANTTQFFTVISNIDPIFVLNANYYFFNAKTNKLFSINQEDHPFYGMFSIQYSSAIKIIPIKEKVNEFVKNYIFYNNPDVVDDTMDTLFQEVFAEALKKYFNDYLTDKTFSYQNFKVNKHTEKNLASFNAQNLFYNFDPEYNFFVKSYETSLSSSTINESLIPNYYVANNYITLENDPRNLKNFLSLNNNIEVTKQNLLSKEYFSNFGDVIKNFSNEQISTLNQVTNYVVDSHYSNLSNISFSSENFPCTAKLTFSNYENDSLISVIEDKKLDTLIANNTHHLFTSNTTEIRQTQTFLTIEDVIVKQRAASNIEQDVLSTKTLLAQEEVYSVPLEEVVKIVTNETDNKTGLLVYPLSNLGFYSKENKQHLDSLKKELSIFPYINFNSKVQEIIKQEAFQYTDMFSFKQLKPYPLGFQVEKYSNNILNNTISIARNYSNSEITFYDTQIKYEKEYNYKVYSLNLINTPTYSYQNNSVETVETDKGYKYKYFQTVLNLAIKPMIFKNTIINKKLEVVDDPPVPVDVNIVPLIGRPSTLLFMLNTQNTSYFDVPKHISDSDRTKFNKIKRKQNLNKDKIFFQTVEDLARVQVFRTTTPPKNYRDFKDSLHLTLGINQTTNFFETLQQNTKYYYTFRSIDVHNNISNPTEVFEVQIINNEGAVYPIINTYNMSLVENQNFNYKKSFKKYISINPSLLYTQFVGQDDGTVKVGENEDLWGQKFKVRIKSKQSGKCFDINLTFKKQENNLIPPQQMITETTTVQEQTSDNELTYTNITQQSQDQAQAQIQEGIEIVEAPTGSPLGKGANINIGPTFRRNVNVVSRA